MSKTKEALELARNKFAIYGGLHLQKDTIEGDRKAEENFELSRIMDRALSQPDHLYLLEELNKNNVKFDIISSNPDNTVSCVIYGRLVGKDFDSLVGIFEEFDTTIKWIYARAKERYPELDWRH